jgi:hypothetical protein
MSKASDPAQVNKIHWKFTVPPAKVIQQSVILSFLHCARCFCRRHSHPQHCTCSLALLRLMFATQSFPKYRYHMPLRSEQISCSRSKLEPKESSRRMRCSEQSWAHRSPQLILERRRFHWVQLLVDRMRVCCYHITIINWYSFCSQCRSTNHRSIYCHRPPHRPFSGACSYALEQ